MKFCIIVYHPSFVNEPEVRKLVGEMQKELGPEISIFSIKHHNVKKMPLYIMVPSQHYKDENNVTVSDTESIGTRETNSD